MKNRLLTIAAATLALSSGGLATTAAHAGGTEHTVHADKAAFVTPSDNMSCVMDDSGVTCAAAEHDWPNLQVDCDTGEGGNLMRLEDTAGPSCIGDPLRLRAVVPGPLTGYLSRAGDAAHTRRPAGDPNTYAVARYGTTFDNGRFQVRVTEDGVTATNLATGHAFTMSKQALSTR